MTAPAGHISVAHGSLTVSVPRSLFRGSGAEPDEEKVRGFGDLLRARYPWLTEGSLEVLMRNARREMLRIIDEETCGRARSRDLAAEGRLEEAVAHLERHLERNPGDADSWYALGELLCRAGRPEEGYRAINRGRDLF
ncbi:MAG: tetratricopeptide repeat protein [Candidatus Methanomethylophilaceae archaeon]|jgi:tetratricopeptide (TPR) repeat protein|nr:tetratricopeptide repeat protein [Candidatus Methanomethylophilaceae archaeon]